MRHAVLLACLFIAACLAGCGGREPVRTPYVPAPVVENEEERVGEPTQPMPPRLGFWRPLLEELIADGFSAPDLYALFSRPDTVFDPEPMSDKLRSLYRLQFGAETTRRIQMGLTELGYTPGSVDGMAGDNTRRAIKAFEEVHGLTQTGEPTAALLTLIEAELALPASRRRPPKATLVESGKPSSLYNSLVTSAQLNKCEEFASLYRDDLLNMERTYGVPAEVAVAILMVETRLGTYLGNRNAFNVLASMARSGDYEVIAPYLGDKPFTPEETAWLKLKAVEKGRWAYKELAALLTYCLDNGHDPLSLPASIYGAVGHCQFMPSNVLAYGRDGDGDGRVNLFTMPDAIVSIGSYLREHGWQGDMSQESRRRAAIFSYNRSQRYVNTVLHIADALSGNI